MRKFFAKGMYPNKEEATLLGGHIHTAALHMQELIDTILKLSASKTKGLKYYLNKPQFAPSLIQLGNN